LRHIKVIARLRLFFNQPLPTHVMSWLASKQTTRLREVVRSGLLALVAAGLVLAMTGAAAAGAARISEFGKYEGYSEATWDGAQRTSDYLTLPGGARLAYDLILPTRKGVPAGEPLPVLFKYTPYLRRFTIFDEQGKNKIGDLFEMKWWERALLQLRYWATDEGRYMDALFRTRWLDRMVKHGYAVIVVERSGTGASFGIANLSHEAGAREADEILDWIARQKWSNGRVGMYGDSFQAMVQLADRIHRQSAPEGDFKRLADLEGPPRSIPSSIASTDRAFPFT
jgi:hypothetical protein